MRCISPAIFLMASAIRAGSKVLQSNPISQASLLLATCRAKLSTPPGLRLKKRLPPMPSQMTRSLFPSCTCKRSRASVPTSRPSSFHCCPSRGTCASCVAQSTSNSVNRKGDFIDVGRQARTSGLVFSYYARRWHRYREASARHSSMGRSRKDRTLPRATLISWS